MFIYVDRSEIVGKNGLFAETRVSAGKISVITEQVTTRLNVLLTDPPESQPALNVFDTKQPSTKIEAFLLGR